jgi:hypothetical protein
MALKLPATIESPLFWTHAGLYGAIQIDMDTHLGLAA